MTTSIRIVAVTVGLVAVAALPALAGAVWVTPAADISSAPESAFSAAVVAATDGSATAVWLNDPGSGVGTVHASHRTGSAWGGDIELAGADALARPSVVVDGDGVVTAA
jgi:hypothetical protein